MKNLFAKAIDTKTDHLAVFVKELGDALQKALDNKVPLSAIERELRSRSAHFTRMLESLIEERSRSPYPVMYDQNTLQPIDFAGQARRAEEKRIAHELREQQRQYAESVNERGRQDAIRQGKVL